MLGQLVFPIARNVAAAAVGRDAVGGSLFPLYHITPYCNLACSYCDGFPEVGVSRDDACRATSPRDRELGTADVERLLAILRRRFAYLFLTGGEPLVRRDIDHLVRAARTLGFRQIAINTNGTLLHEHDDIVDLFSTIVLSLDSLGDGRDRATAGKDGRALAAIVENVRRYAPQQERRGFKLVVHTVVLPGRLDLAEEVARFALDCGAWVCISPLQHDYAVPPALAASGEYRALIDRVLGMKRAGRRISGSAAFYRNIRDGATYRCHPFVIPRILPSGHLLYPCRPQGAVGGSVLEHGSWERAVREARERFGPIPACRRSCRIRCYIEPSLALSGPWRVAREVLR
jgi:MoaA/NifB/PqqE/SkfB family radical SAM enzyme